MLLCALSAQYECDQWTFCKPTASELASLYGVRIEELNVWRSLIEQVRAQVDAGRLVLVEADAFYLPDTAGVSYGIAHQKTTIGVRSLDLAARRMEYFHNAGAFSLGGDDFDGVFDTRVTAAALPPFAELADFSRLTPINDAALYACAGSLAQQRLHALPADNPYEGWARAADAQLHDLAARDLANFHAWAFATVRQAGSMSELTAVWCDWMRARSVPAHAARWHDAAAAMAQIAQTLAAQQFRLARIPAGGAHAGFSSALLRCAAQWSSAVDAMRAALAPPSSL
jgi:hypothetical protein